MKECYTLRRVVYIKDTQYIVYKEYSLNEIAASRILIALLKT